MKLTAIIYPDPETDWLVAECPEIGMASQGKTEEEALGNLREATELYLESFQKTRFLRRPPAGKPCGDEKITSEGERGCVIPMHREVALGTLRSALKMAGVSPDDFTSAL